MVAAAAGHPEGAIAAAGVAPAAKQALQAGAIWVRRRWFAQAERAVEEGAAIAGLAPEELVSRLVATPGGGELFWEAVQAAAHAGVEAKIRALGRALATGALGEDEKVVDRERLFVQAMADIEEQHLKVLAALDESHSPSGREYLFPVTLSRLEESSGVGSAIHPLFATLQRHGLVEAVPPDLEQIMRKFGQGLDAFHLRNDMTGRWQITAIGRECVDRLRAAGREAEEEGA